MIVECVQLMAGLSSHTWHTVSVWSFLFYLNVFFLSLGRFLTELNDPELSMWQP